MDPTWDVFGEGAIAVPTPPVACVYQSNEYPLATVAVKALAFELRQTFNGLITTGTSVTPW